MKNDVGEEIYLNLVKTVTVDNTIDLPCADNIEVRFEKNKLWVNLDGRCILRIYRIKRLEVRDDRHGQKR